jgi:hypothetical protein
MADSRHHFPRHPDLVDRLEVTRPDQLWVADIRYVQLREEEANAPDVS